MGTIAGFEEINEMRKEVEVGAIIIIELILVTFIMAHGAIEAWQASETVNVFFIACFWLFSCSLIIVFNAGVSGLLFGPNSRGDP